MTKRARYLTALGSIAVLTGGAFFGCSRQPDKSGEEQSYQPPPLVFNNDSDKLKSTVIVPTLDTPLPTGKNAIWCGSFQLAWNELRQNVTKEPVDLQGADEVVQRLNRSTFSPEDLTPAEFYAAAGLISDGIDERIRKEMKARFPDVAVPQFGAGNVAIAYAYLHAAITFALPYFEDSLEFVDSVGTPSQVKAFGIRQIDSNRMLSLRDQIEVLFVSQVGEEPTEFALDLCRKSSPNQIVVASTTRRETLAATLDHVRKQIANHAKLPEGSRDFGGGDQLLVPTMHWRIDHHFNELMGTERRFENAALKDTYLNEACQMIHLKLDRSGADLKSEAAVNAKSQSRRFHLDGPYLIYMQKRDASSPFFVMWVDNAELMVK